MPLGRRPEGGDARNSGVELGFHGSLEAAVQAAAAAGFDFVAVPLVDPGVGRRDPSSLPPPDALIYTTASELAPQVVGCVSPWLDLDAADDSLREASTSALSQELAWAEHLSLQAVLLPSPPSPLDCPNYARAVAAALPALQGLQLWLRLPLLSPAVAAASPESESEALLLTARHGPTRRPLHDPYCWWDAFRTVAESHPSLGLALEMGPSLPPADECARWVGEPVRAVLLSTAAFSTNKRGYPVLSRRHQELLQCFFGHNVQVVLTGGAEMAAAATAAPSPSEADPTPAEAAARMRAGGGAGAGRGAADAADADDADVARAGAGAAHPLRPYWDYLAYLYRRMPPLAPQEAAEFAYRDFLQAPLQPLADNLESATYETFEKDGTKYAVYGEAIRRALLDAPTPKTGDATVVMVVGAGRGPLVRAALEAAARADRRVRLYAVEKNPNAVVHLRRLIADRGWGGLVTIVATDMRRWAPPELATVLVSELLGSWGDNELSPECLDGAQRLLAPGGVSIPQSYTSYLQPVTSAKLHGAVGAYGDRSHFETAYVVKASAVAPLAPTLPVFTFDHPRQTPEDPQGNARRVALVWPRPGSPAATLHGFVGYFDAQLYKDVHLSTHAPSRTPNMFSWFSLFIPLRTPVLVGPGAAVSASFWRVVGASKVWYEWALSGPEVGALHNANGRSYWVGL